MSEDVRVHTHHPHTHAKETQREAAVWELGGGKEKTVHDSVVLSPFLWAVKQTAWQSCLPRQVNKMKQSPGATAGKHYHFEGSQKN